MNLISEDVMWDLIFNIILDHKSGDPIASKIVRASCDYLSKNVKDGCSTEDICDSVLSCFDFYNDYVDQKNIDLKKISKPEYDMTVIMLNAAINLILEESDGS